MTDGVRIQVKPEHIDFINKIMEGYEYFGVVTTQDKEKGILLIRVTPDTYEEVKKILIKLPISCEFV